MKHKLNVLLIAIIAGLTCTAYGLCYLEQVVCCAISGDNLGTKSTIVLEIVGGTTAISGGSLTLYADASAWRSETYSVSKGGFGSSAFTSYCDPDVTQLYNETYNRNTGGAGYFACHYYDSSNGATGTCHSSDPYGNNTASIWVNYSVTGHRINGTTCP